MGCEQDCAACAGLYALIGRVHNCRPWAGAERFGEPRAETKPDETESDETKRNDNERCPACAGLYALIGRVHNCRPWAGAERFSISDEPPRAAVTKPADESRALLRKPSLLRNTVVPVSALRP